MRTEDILKLLREGSQDVMQGLEILQALGKTLSDLSINISTAAQQGKKLVEVVDRISKRVDNKRS